MGDPRGAGRGTARPPLRACLPDLVVALLLIWPTILNGPRPSPLLAPQAATALYLVLLAVCCTAIAARRLAPLAGVLVIGTSLVVHLVAFSDLSILMILAGLIAVETTQSRLDPPWRWILLAGAALGASVAVLRGLYLVGGEPGRAPLLLASAWMAVALAAFVGAWRRRGRDRFEQALERAAVLEAQQATERRLAVAEERQRIARDVHDLLGHSLSVIAMQAEGARAILAADPEAADRALAVIGETSRRSVDEVHALVDVLRSDDAPSASPCGTVAGLPGQAGGTASAQGGAGSPAAPAGDAAGDEAAAGGIAASKDAPGEGSAGGGAIGTVSSAVSAVRQPTGQEGGTEPHALMGPGPAPSSTGALGGASGTGEDDDVVEALVRLVRQARRAGAPVRLRLDAAERGAPSIPAAAGLVLERAAQEALTNALRHAPGAAVRVELAVTGEGAELTVTNAAASGAGQSRPGSGPPPEPVAEGPSGGGRAAEHPRGRGGFGLIAMRERVVAAGGALSAGPTSSGGWQVRARLPLAGPGAPSASPAPPASAAPSSSARPGTGSGRGGRIGALS
ncbi:hypothetical protein MANAM107_09410 [Actinomyces capricornis]|uniref:histidine kinase n=2 Tax=Actinomyces capricornis TaxID=2755559 RepID=A0ABM7U9X3_9ACTO|nr:hypothetical protein MANAM107_09410 [Actinomyces capricornis]